MFFCYNPMNRSITYSMSKDMINDPTAKPQWVSMRSRVPWIPKMMCSKHLKLPFQTSICTCFSYFIRSMIIHLLNFWNGITQQCFILISLIVYLEEEKWAKILKKRTTNDERIRSKRYSLVGKIRDATYINLANSMIILCLCESW